MGQYENILKALQGQTTRKTDSPRQLSVEERSRNYQIFDEIMKKGISLDEVLKSAESRKDASGIDSEVFSVMEEAVKDDQTVVATRSRASSLKAQIVTEMCLKDDRYRSALEEYRKAVSEAYVKKKESIKSEEPIQD